LAFTFSTTLAVAGTRAASRSARAPPLAQRHEAQEPLAGGLVVDGQRARPRLPAELAEQRVQRIGLEQAALDVEDHVVPVGLVEPDHGARRDRELHLVAVAVLVGGGQDRPHRELAEAADPLEAVAHLLCLKGELRRVGQVLQAAPAAAAEVRTRRLDAIRRRRLDRLDHGAPEARAGFDELHPHPVARHSAAHEHDVAVDAPHALPAKRQVVDGEHETVAAPRFRHDRGHYIKLSPGARGPRGKRGYDRAR
jgi:hypothetical protein